MKNRRKASILLVLLFLSSCATGFTPRSERSRDSAASRGQALPNAPEASLPAARPLPPRRGASIRLELPPLPDDAVSRYMAQMSLDQKLGQRFMCWIPGTTLTKRSRDMLAAGIPGGILLTAQNVVSAPQVRELTAALQRLAREARPVVPLFIAVEQEGGRFNRLRFSPVTQFPPPFTWGEREDPALVESIGYITARELVALGCNMNLAPVIDLSGRADESVIGNRSLGWKPDVVGALGSAYVRGSARGGVLAVVKHFPGHGITLQDSHATLPAVEVTEDFLWQRHLRPFRIAVKGGADAFMAAHIVYKNIDPAYPASLSEKLIQGVLRNELGFEGLVVSDEINVPSLARAYPLGRIVSGALRAGVDLILVSDVYTIADLKREALKLLAAREISRDDIDRGVARILAVKAKYGLIL